MSLFQEKLAKELHERGPLATRMRPQSLADFEGQQRIIGPGTMLRQILQNDLLQSMILYGPPGSGKTTLAHIIANMTKARFHSLNAVMAGVKEIREIADSAERERAYYGIKTVLFLDEIHRLNKSQQDALLPFVESGLITLIGATTENPMFAVNKALISRCRLFALEPLPDNSVRRLLEKALQDEEMGLGCYQVEVLPEALDHLAKVANGDARSALNALEIAVLSTEPGANGVRRIGLEQAEEAIQQRALNYTRDGDEHYDIISALIKSIRGSDPQAALYWLARMLYAGEDISFICRRLCILAAEDIGLAEPNALVVVNAGAQIVERVGMPEARIVLSELVIYLCLAPKSNSAYRAIQQAMAEVEHGLVLPVPIHLRDSGGGSGKALGYGKGYRYPHDYPGHWVEQVYLPRELQKKSFYVPSEEGKEPQMQKIWQQRREKTGNSKETP